MFFRFLASAVLLASSNPSTQNPTAIPVGVFDDSVRSVAREASAQVEAGNQLLVFEINSPGGSVYAGLFLIKHIEQLRKQGVHTACIVDASAFSMAFLFLESDACEYRFMTKRSLLLAHGVSTSVEGNARDVSETLAFVKALNAAMAELATKRMAITAKDYLARTAKGDWVMSWQEALAVGAIDGVVDESDVPAWVKG